MNHPDVPYPLELLYSGHDLHSHHGVGLLLSPSARRSLSDWSPVSERIISARFVTSKARLSVFCVYAPTLESSDSVHRSFYDSLHSQVLKVPSHDMLLILGDFNAHTGTDRTGFHSSLGPWCDPSPRNKSGVRLLDFCVQNRLSVTNTFFRHKPAHQFSYTSPDGQHRHMLDLVLVNHRFRSSVLDTRAHRSASLLVESDHELVVSKIRLKLKTYPKTSSKPRIDSARLAFPETAKAFARSVAARLPSLPSKHSPDSAEPEQLWATFKDAILPSALEHCGLVRHPPRPWITPALMQLVVDKAAAFQKFRDSKGPQKLHHQKAYKALKNRCKIQTRKCYKQAWSDAARQLEHDVKLNHLRPAYSQLKQFVRPRSRPPQNLNDRNGNPLTAPQQKLQRWCEHFSDLLNSDAKVDAEELKLPPPPEPPDSDDPPPTLSEVSEAVNRLKNHKAPGVCAITAEMLKHGGPQIVSWLHRIITRVWTTERSPQDWKDAIIVPVFKNKGSRLECDRHRGISLLSVPGKVYALVLLTRVSQCMEATVLENQAGFRKSRSATDQIFILSQVLSGAFEFRVPVHTCFVDLLKAYDKVNRDALWLVCERSGISPKILRLLQDLHSDTHSSIRSYGCLSKPFLTNNGVRQGCVLAPALFALFLDYVVRVALSDTTDGVTLRYTVDGQLRVTPVRPGQIDLLLQILLYADDMAIVCDSAEGLERLVFALESATQRFLLPINQSKTKLLSIDPLHVDRKPSITLRGVSLEHISDSSDAKEQQKQDKKKPPSSFKYLGRTFTTHPELKTEISVRLAKASKSFWNLSAPLYRRKDISIKTKVSIFSATVLPSLLWGSETWAPKLADIHRLESFQMRCARYMLGISYATHGLVSYASLRKSCGLVPIESLLRTRRLRWLGHLSRMDSHRLPRKVLFSILGEGRPQGRPFTSWRQHILNDLRYHGIQSDWVSLAADRAGWRRLIKSVEPHRQRRSDRLKREVDRLRY